MSKPVGSGAKYRAEIDGLRCIAVLAVVIYHNEFRRPGLGCPGGYVGVDVFFVLSGFLITSLIWDDLLDDRFSFLGFWERRARRILPALIVLGAVCLLTGYFLLLPDDLKELGAAAAALATFTANFLYFRLLDYFNSEVGVKPLIHTWSLAVEEQFYLIMPALMWGVFQVRNHRHRPVLVAVLSSLLLLSLASATVDVSRHSSSAFYLLPGRAWELLLGALVALAPSPERVRLPQMVLDLLALGGFCMIVLPVVYLYDSATPFPGLAALLPCGGTALVVWSNTRQPDAANAGAPTGVGKLLSQRPFVWIGLISYSLYLWHWPFLAFPHYLSVQGSSLGLERLIRLALLGGQFLSAWLSYRYVETPFRQRRLASSRPAIFRLALSGTGMVLIWGLAYFVLQGLPHRLSPQQSAFYSARFDKDGSGWMTLDKHQQPLPSLGVPGGGGRPDLVVWGDSHGHSALPAFDALLKERQLSGYAACYPGYPPVMDWSAPLFGLTQETIMYNQTVFDDIQQKNPRNVVLVAFWKTYVVLAGKSTPNTFHAKLVETVRRLSAIGAHPIVMLDVPAATGDVPRVLALGLMDEQSLCGKPGATDVDLDPSLTSDIESAGASILDPKPAFLDATRSFYAVRVGDTVLYNDNSHLSVKGATMKLLPFLRTHLNLGGR